MMKPALERVVLASPGLLLLSLGWVVALGGLAAIQHECNSDISATSCDDLLHYEWFIWSFAFLVVIINAAYGLGGKLNRLFGASVGFNAILAALSIQMTERYYSAVKGTDGNLERRLQVILVGFAFMASAALLLLLTLSPPTPTENRELAEPQLAKVEEKTADTV